MYSDKFSGTSPKESYLIDRVDLIGRKVMFPDVRLRNPDTNKATLNS